MLYTTIHNSIENYEMEILHNKLHKVWQDAAKQMNNHSTTYIQVPINYNLNIFVVKLVIRKLKDRPIKSKSQKFRIKRYKETVLYKSCVVDIDEPQETETTITYPVNITYKANPEKININMVISRDEENAEG